MKIRVGFVSNSSSSNFLVAWPDKIKTFEDVKNYLDYTEHANIILDDALTQEPIQLVLEDWIIEDMINEMRCYFDILVNPNYQDSIIVDFTEYSNDREEYTKRYEYSIRELAEKFIEENLGKYLYTFNISDDDGNIYSDMEHNDIFAELSYIRISKH